MISTISSPSSSAAWICCHAAEGCRPAPSRARHQCDGRCVSRRDADRPPSRLLAPHPLAPQAIDVNTLINGMSNLLLRTLGETVSVEFVLAGDLAKTWVDPNQLENAILNLCVNAVDAMPKGGTLTLTTANMVVDPTQRHAGLETGAYVENRGDRYRDRDAGQRGCACVEPFFTTKPVGKGRAWA